MELFKNANYDFLGWKKPFIVLSLVLLGAGGVSLVLKGGPKYGIDFRGGTTTTIKFAKRPPEDQIRRALSARISGEVTVQPIIDSNEVIVGTELRSAQELDQARKLMRDTAHGVFSA